MPIQELSRSGSVSVSGGAPEDVEHAPGNQASAGDAHIRVAGSNLVRLDPDFVDLVGKQEFFDVLNEAREHDVNDAVTVEGALAWFDDIE